MNSKPQHYCLQWNNYQTHVIELFVQLLEANSLVDVTLSVERKTIYAHRIILSACSSYFQEMFTNAEDSHPIVILSDMRYDDVKSVIEFIYRGELSVSAERVASVLQVARELKVRGLMEVSSSVLEIDRKSSGLSDTVVDCSNVPEVPSIEHSLNEDVNELELEEVETETECFIGDTEDVLCKADSSPLLVEVGRKIANEKVCGEEIKKPRRRDSSKKNYSEGVMIEALDDLRAGRSLLETSLSHHIPRSTLYSRARSQGVPMAITRQEHSQETIHAAVQAVAGGASLQQAAQQYKIPKTVLWRRMHKEQLKNTSRRSGTYNKSKPRYTAEKRQAAVKALETGDNLSRVSEQFQIPVTTLFRDKSRLVEAGRLPWTCLRKRNLSGDSFKQHRLAEAVAACKNGKMSQATASITYKVPKTTIWRQMRKDIKDDPGYYDAHCEEFPPCIEYQEQLIESEEVHECVGQHQQSEYSLVEIDNSEIPVTYIDEDADFSEASLIILNGSDAQTIALPEHGEQIVVDSEGNEVLDSSDT